MNISRQFAANIVETGFDSLDNITVERAKWRILDTIGCAIAGADAPGCAAMLMLVKKWGGAAESTILAHGGTAPAHHAAMLNSLMARSFDFEPVEAEGENTSSPAHISGSTVPASLAVAESRAATGKELITALALGDDLAARLGVASGFDFDFGWDNTGTINAFGAAAAAAKLLGLDENQIYNSFGIVLNSLGGSMDGVYDKTVAFKLPIALSARNGIFAAELAAQGFAGVNDPFLGVHGFFALYCRHPDTRNLTKDLGKRFYGDAVIKLYSACRMTHSSIDSAMKIVRGHDIKAEDIKEIEVRLSPATYKGFCSKPFASGEPQVEAAFSIPYTVACALLRQGVKPAYFTAEAIRDPAIQRLIDIMTLLPAIPPEKRMATEMQVKMKDGNVFTARTDDPSGHVFKSPLTVEEIKAKYRSNVAFSRTVPVKKAEKALALIENLEEMKDVRELTALLVR